MSKFFCNVAIVDDDPLFAEFLRLELVSKVSAECQIDAYCEIDKFFDELKAKPNAYNLIVVDRFLGEYDSVSHQFPRSCRYDGYQGKIVLVSSCNLPNTNDKATKDFNLILKKGPNMNWQEVLDIAAV